MAGKTKEAVEEVKRRIISSCVKMFIEKGYKGTRFKDIVKDANVSTSTIANLFGSKDGILLVLTESMFENQFDIAKGCIGEDTWPVLLYALETSIQLTITELNENLRDIYVEAYTQPTIMELIHKKTSLELFKIFGEYLPKCTQSDFYELEIGTASIMRGYMAKPCDMYFTLERKIQCFLTITLRVFNVPEEEQERIFNYIKKLDIQKIANEVIQKMFTTLAMKFDFTLNNKEE